MPNNPSFTNHLQGEKSPYLLQHAHNPVQWYPWGKQAFDKARQEDKPVLLSVGYSTCHWCHVMAHESFEDETIAQIINEHFVAVKVDREERPDIDHIYMTATTAMTGQGGWPLTVFLTPEAHPFYGGTYFPPQAKWGSIGFIDLLRSIAAGWKSDRENILSSGMSITESLQARQYNGQAGEGDLDEDLLHRAFRQMRGQFDKDYGGFGSAPKFPMGHNLSFLLRYHQQYEAAEAMQMVEKSLESMAKGGIWDHLGGGFHRYSTDRVWHVPHFEKMLYDQALLARAYLEGYQATGALGHAQLARGILDYVLNEMTDPEGGFYSAQDADSLDPAGGGAGAHLKEGAYYVFSQAEIEEVLGAGPAAIFNYYYGIKPEGNADYDPHGEFIGKNILYQAHSVEETQAQFPGQKNEIHDILEVSRKKLLARRSLRPRPHLDDKVLCDWNGLMISSLSFGSRVLAEPIYLKAACRAADFILSRMRTPEGRLWHRWREKDAGIDATLEDYAFFIYGLVDTYEASFEGKYLKAAEELAGRMMELFSDPAGGFFMTAADAPELIFRPKEIYDGALPSGNSVAALVLLRLSALTQKEIYKTKAEGLFNCFAPTAAQAPSAHSFFLSALGWRFQPPKEITFEGRMDDAEMARMLKVLYKHFIPVKAVLFKPSPIHAKAHICLQGRCLAPVEAAASLEAALMQKL